MNVTSDDADGGPLEQSRSVRFRKQFLKTQLCQLYLRGKCQQHELCRYAHGEGELRQAPDLCKTALCPGGSNCQDENCRFAHHWRELRATKEFLKKDPCKYFIQTGRCVLGKNCRYSHNSDLYVGGQHDQEENFQASSSSAGPTAGQRDQAESVQASSSAAGPTAGQHDHAESFHASSSSAGPTEGGVEFVGGLSAPRRTQSFQGRRALYGGSGRELHPDMDAVPHRSLAFQAGQLDRSRPSSAAGPAEGHFQQQFVDRIPVPKAAKSFQGRRDLYGDAVPARALPISAAAEAPRALQLPPAPPLPEDSLPPPSRLRHAPPTHHNSIMSQDSRLQTGSLFFEDVNNAHATDDYSEVYYDGPPRPSQAFVHHGFFRNTGPALGTPAEDFDFDNPMNSFASSRLSRAQETSLPQHSRQSVAFPETVSTRSERASNGEARSGAFPRGRVIDDDRTATGRRGSTFHNDAYFRGEQPETRMPSGQFVSQDTSSHHVNSGWQHSHRQVLPDTAVNLEPCPHPSSVSALPPVNLDPFPYPSSARTLSAAAGGTPGGLGATAFWL
eukprot:TRINITY_DN9912_c0_g1_i1.p1 TRINITY_DN9912_c0_g1~~TRINITY_DN9912_c0_g1_i1.p1  ORF type:complete len:557 (+),score=53.62 TRINITY_DN9912_c0_g1_i1:16-1686(+)